MIIRNPAMILDVSCPCCHYPRTAINEDPITRDYTRSFVTTTKDEYIDFPKWGRKKITAIPTLCVNGCYVLSIAYLYKSLDGQLVYRHDHYEYQKGHILNA